MFKKISFLVLSFSSLTFGQEIDLSVYEKSIYSQNGEDGLLAKIFQVIPPTSKFCVEFGAYDGILNSNTFLLRLQGWDSLLLDRAFHIPEFNLYKEFITADNINELFNKYNVPENFDLLSIDLDYNDFYIWKALDQKYKPAVVLIEYNAFHSPSEDKVVKYLPYFCGDGSNYYGASIQALYQLGKSKGYTLVYAETVGVNLFFVRDDLLETSGISFKDMGDVEKIYHLPTYGEGPKGGARADKRERSYVSSKELIENK